MAIATERGKAIFRKTERELRRLAAERNPETVHRFRTTTRRLQILVGHLVASPDRNQRKLLKMLNRVRKTAGKVRDVDVQLSALRSIKAQLEPRRKTQLVQGLLELRAKHEAKLDKLLKKSAIRELIKRLKRSEKDLDLKTRRDPIALAKQFLVSVPLSATAIDEDTMHRYRIAVKRARYAAEFAPASVESRRFIAKLKRMQDALGNWHDWFTLTHTAQDRLGEVTQSSLVAALHNITRAKFRLALAVVSAQPAATPVEKPKGGPEISDTKTPPLAQRTAAA